MLQADAHAGLNALVQRVASPQRHWQLPGPTWTIADRLPSSGAAAAIVPSFAVGAIQARDVNLVFWRWGRDLPHMVQVIDERGRLPRKGSSWG